MTVAPLIAMKSTKCESLEAVGKGLTVGRTPTPTMLTRAAGMSGTCAARGMRVPFRSNRPSSAVWAS